jgi:hypothetical protein
VFYVALAWAKKSKWITGGGPGQPYVLESSGTWKEALKPPYVGECQEREQLGAVVELQLTRIQRLEAKNRRLNGSRKALAAGEAAGGAVAALMSIMANSTVTMRRRLQAAENLLAYRTPTDVSEAARLFLSSVFSDVEMNIDFRLAAAQALRKSEEPRIVAGTERPSPPVHIDTEAEEEERRLEHERKLKHINELAAKNTAELAREFGRSFTLTCRHRISS